MKSFKKGGGGGGGAGGGGGGERGRERGGGGGGVFVEPLELLGLGLVCLSAVHLLCLLIPC